MQTAITAGVLRPYLPGAPANASPTLTLLASSNGLIALSGGSVIGWIYPGACRSSAGHHHFYDVAFPRQTTTRTGKLSGNMLDSETFDTEAAALAFVKSLVQAGGAA